jgi:hypothetical protein
MNALEVATKQLEDARAAVHAAEVLLARVMAETLSQTTKDDKETI